MKHNVGIFFSLIAFFYTGCASSSPVSSPTPPTPTPETIQGTPTNPAHPTVLWKITPTSQSHTYSSLVSTVITEVGPPTSRRDSLTAEALYSISLTRRADTLSVSGLMLSFAVKGETPEISEPQLTFPIPFTGTVTSRSIKIQRSAGQALSSNSCSNGSEASLKTVRRTLFLLPLEITDQQTWTDSTSSNVCSGTLPLILTSIRTFRVSGELELDGFPALVIDENEKTFSKGEGSQGQHQIFVEAQGSTSGRLYIDRSSGQLLTANLTTTSSLSIQSSGRVQHFLQSSTEILKQLVN
jgi:hypothetical protein